MQSSSYETSINIKKQNMFNKLLRFYIFIICKGCIIQMGSLKVRRK